MYFFIKNFKTKKQSKKLDHVKIGSFLIKEVKGPLDYELILPTDAKMFPVFNIFLLKPASPDTPLATIFRYYTEKKTNTKWRKSYDKMVRIISSNGRTVTRQKIFGNRSKTLGIAKPFCDSSTKINSRSIEIFKDEIFRSHIKQKVFRFRTSLFGRLFFSFQLGYMRDFVFDQNYAFFSQSINFALQTVEFNKSFFSLLRFFISFFPDTSPFGWEKKRQVAIYQIFAGALRTTARYFANFAVIGGPRIFTVKTNPHDRRTRLENGRHKGIAKRN